MAIQLPDREKLIRDFFTYPIVNRSFTPMQRDSDRTECYVFSPFLPARTREWKNFATICDLPSPTFAVGTFGRIR